MGQHVLSLIAEGLRLDGDYFDVTSRRDPTVLFRSSVIRPTKHARGWGVGAHTDYGLLTLLQQDTIGGLQVLESTSAGSMFRRSPTRSSATSATCWSG